MSYSNPVSIVETQDFLSEIDKRVSGGKILLVAAPSFLRGSYAHELKNLNICKTISNVKSHPELRDVFLQRQEVRGIEFDMILAVGGGSVLDSAKALAFRGDDANFMQALLSGTGVEDHAGYSPILAIPTTAGTGSEVTPWATLWDREKQKKYSLTNPGLFPKFAIYDARLTLSLPDELTIDSALDSLSHAFESIWNRNRNVVSEVLATQAIGILINEFQREKLQFQDIHFRRNLMRASMLAGLAFSNTRTAIAHALSYGVTIKAGTAHGRACSFSLPALARIAIRQGIFSSELINLIGSRAEILDQMFRGLQVSVDPLDYLNQDQWSQIIYESQGVDRMSNSLISVGSLRSEWGI